MTERTSQRTAAYWIRTLDLSDHPEGGWYRESYRSDGSIPAVTPPGVRSVSTAIHFLVERGRFSALHRINSDELWHFYTGAPLTVHIITPDGEHRRLLLGGDPEAGESFQGVVPAGCWFGAETAGEFSLVGCTVAPGFDFADFELARRDELTAQYPQHRALIARLTRG